MNPNVLKRIDRLLGFVTSSLVPSFVSSKTFPSHDPAILLIRPGGIGDAVLLVPAIRLLKKQLPEADVDILAERRNAGVFPLCPGIRSVYRYDVPSEFLTVLRRRYDIVIDTEQWHRLSAVTARLIRSSVKVGFGTNERRRMFSHAIAYSHDRYEAGSFFDLIAPLGVRIPASVDVPFLCIPENVLEKAKVLLGDVATRPYAVIFPGASISERCWGKERFGRVGACLFHRGMSVVVVGASTDAVMCKKICSLVPGSLNLAGQTTLAETAAVITGASVLVSGDSGVLHMGMGLGVPTVSLFGPGIARKWAPRGKGHRVLNYGLPCSPCTRYGTTPPCPHGVKCLAGISPEEVLAAAEELLRSGEKPLDFSLDG